MSGTKTHHPLSAQDFWSEADTLGAAVLNTLEYFEDLGVSGLSASIMPPEPSRLSVAHPRDGHRRSQQPVMREKPSNNENEAVNNASKKQTEAKTLSDLADINSQCVCCPAGAIAPGNPVFGRGSSAPLIALVGVTPSIYEGPDNELLKAIIEKGLKLAPQDYYITTLLRCPIKDESDIEGQKKAQKACLPFLIKELKFLKPKIVLAMGSRPGQALSGSNDPVGLLRTKTHAIDGLDGVWLRVTFGLSHMLNSQEIKKEAWKDMQRIIAVLSKLK